uniref:Uncharacterized protein n=1 Tax=Arundo donax TaxID=35708 RepID=A0A0A9I1D2_ARUDO
MRPSGRPTSTSLTRTSSRPHPPPLLQKPSPPPRPPLQQPTLTARPSCLPLPPQHIRKVGGCV